MEGLEKILKTQEFMVYEAAFPEKHEAGGSWFARPGVGLTADRAARVPWSCHQAAAVPRDDDGALGPSCWRKRTRRRRFQEHSRASLRPEKMQPPTP
ncbi:hypothetical protein HQ524_03670 [Candidatus Uhrbacteria bacterium]|nr:hypothetical protein [Candidatus Uhrbacteria bacterium]